MDTPSLTSMKQDAGGFAHVRINFLCRGVHRLKGQTLNYGTLIYCSSNNLTLDRHTKTLANKHKMPFKLCKEKKSAQLHNADTLI